MPLVLQLLARCDECRKESPVQFEMPEHSPGVSEPKYEGEAATWLLPHGKHNPTTVLSGKPAPVLCPECRDRKKAPDAH